MLPASASSDHQNVMEGKEALVSTAPPREATAETATVAPANGREEDDDDPNPTIAQELDYGVVRKELQKYERLLQRRKKRHAT